MSLKFRVYLPVLELSAFVIMLIGLAILYKIDYLNFLTTVALLIVANLIVLNKHYFIVIHGAKFTMIPLSPINQIHRINLGSIAEFKSYQQLRLEDDLLMENVYPILSTKYKLKYMNNGETKEIDIHIRSSQLAKFLSQFPGPIKT